MNLSINTHLYKAQELQPVIGLEVHIQLKTKNKMFTGTPYIYGAPVNTLTDPLVLGLPGSLPIINQRAVYKTIQVGLLFNCNINRQFNWDRKNYFYPDLSKGYQISQYYNPICKNGFVEIELPGPARNIMGKHRNIFLQGIHLEEDVGKLNHSDNETLIDYNRSGVALIEIVTKPDLHSIDEVFAFLKSLKSHLMCADISNCDMEKGEMRCDVNISIRPKDKMILGTKVEIKNLNSITNVCNSIAYEIQRQTKIIQKKGLIIQETRRWLEKKQITDTLRKKENVNDYRYLPDPDLGSIHISEETLNCIRHHLPEMPFIKQRRYLKIYSLPYTITSVICHNPLLITFFETALSIHNHPKAIANFLVNEFLREISKNSLGFIKPIHIAELVLMIDQGMMTTHTAKEILMIINQKGQSPKDIIKDKKFHTINDENQITIICKKIINNHPKVVKDFKLGNKNVINVLKGELMKLTKGRVNHQLAHKILIQILSF